MPSKKNLQKGFPLNIHFLYLVPTITPADLALYLILVNDVYNSLKKKKTDQFYSLGAIIQGSCRIENKQKNAHLTLHLHSPF